MLNQWKKFAQILSKKERVIFWSSLTVFLVSTGFLIAILYLKNTQVKPASGGQYTEGVIGGPRLINPIYAPANDIDRDLAELLFSGLMKHTAAGQIVKDLVKDYQVLEEGKVYEFSLKENALWQDGEPLTGDDVVFTVKTIQNPEYKSPLRANWLGVEVEKLSETQVKFKLKNPSPLFLENTTLKILPKHIWENVSAINFPLTIYNLKPVGSGPYRLKDLKQNREGKITSLTLIKNQSYHGQLANISQISFKFYQSEKDLLAALQKKDIDGLTLNSYLGPEKYGSEVRLVSVPLPRYFAVFFNQQKAKIFSEKEVRTALNYATDRKEIISRLLANQGKIVDSPILPEIYNYNPPDQNYEFDLFRAQELLEKMGFLTGPEGIREKAVKKEASFQFKSNLRPGSSGTEVKELQKCLARFSEIYPEGEITGSFGGKTKSAVIKFQEKYRNDILTPQGLEKGTGDVLKSTRDKLNEICPEKSEEKIQLKFSLTTSDHPQLIKTAQILKEQWQKIGVEIEIRPQEVNSLEREVIKPRNFEAILFGEVLGSFPDPFPFWHSSQKKDPGLNLALYENKEADKMLEEARQTLDKDKTKASLEKFQNILISDAPAIFLYNPDYLYLINKKIKGANLGLLIDPSKRFSEAEKWYISTKRVFK